MWRNERTSEFCFEKSRGKYRSCCKECVRAACKAYKASNRGKIADYNKVYKADHKDEISVYNHDYSKENREAIQKRQNAQHRERRKTDPNYRISLNLRSRLCEYIKSRGKHNKTLMEKLLGCDWCAFEFYFDFLFLWDDEMDWDNYGTYWSIDHVDPCCNYDLTIEENQYVCFHWSNTRPLERLENQKKQVK